jgi:hypothetical protein
MDYAREPYGRRRAGKTPWMSPGEVPSRLSRIPREIPTIPFHHSRSAVLSVRAACEPIRDPKNTLASAKPRSQHAVRLLSHSELQIGGAAQMPPNS